MNSDAGRSTAVVRGASRRALPERIGRALNGPSQAKLLLLYTLLALCLLPATAFFGFIVPQTPARLVRTSADLIPELGLWTWLVSLPLPVPDTRITIAASLLVFIFMAFAAYGAALYLSWKRTAPTRVFWIVAGMGLLFSFVNVWSLPNLNTDIYTYILRGRVAAVYGENPYDVVSDEFPDDPFYPYASERYTAEPEEKLPIWMALNIFLARIAGHDPIMNLLTYRLVLFFFNAAILALIILIVRRLYAPYALSGVVFYSWNPIVILFAQSKSDTMMALLVLLAALFLVKGRTWWLSFVLLVLSALIKLVTVPLLAVYLVRSLKLKRWSELAGAVLVGALLAGTAFLLLYLASGGGHVVQMYVGILQLGGSSTPDIMRNVVRLAFIAVAIAAGFLQDGSDRSLLRGWAVVMLFFALFITRFNLSWYLITPIAIVALAPDWRMALVTFGLSFSSFLFNSWDTTFTTDFPSPNVIVLPRILIYLSLPALVAVYVVARMAWRRLQM